MIDYFLSVFLGFHSKLIKTRLLVIKEDTFLRFILLLILNRFYHFFWIEKNIEKVKFIIIVLILCHFLFLIILIA